MTVTYRKGPWLGKWKSVGSDGWKIRKDGFNVFYEDASRSVAFTMEIHGRYGQWVFRKPYKSSCNLSPNEIDEILDRITQALLVCGESVEVVD